MKRTLATMATGLLISAVPLVAVAPMTPTAHAEGCVHRGAGHWDHHGGLEDDRFHLAHGEQVSCHDPDDGRRHDEDPEEPGEPHEVHRHDHEDEHAEDHQAHEHERHDEPDHHGLHLPGEHHDHEGRHHRL